MPELPEVQTVVSGLSQTIVGKTIESCYSSGQTFRGRKMIIDPHKLVSSTITSCFRRAKYILIELSNGHTLIIHLGMSGKVLIGAEARKHDHLILTFKDRTILRFNDPRRFGVVKLSKSNNLSEEPLLKNLGLEPLEPEFSARALRIICKNSAMPIKSLIMNANLIVGVGNIYASEALFDARILPTRKAHTLVYEEISNLYASIVRVLTLAIESGGSTLRDYAHLNGDVGYFQHQFKVYGKQTEGCAHCNSPVQRIIMSGRSTYFCSSCQH